MRGYFLRLWVKRVNDLTSCKQNSNVFHSPIINAGAMVGSASGIFLSLIIRQLKIVCDVLTYETFDFCRFPGKTLLLSSFYQILERGLVVFFNQIWVFHVYTRFVADSCFQDSHSTFKAISSKTSLQWKSFLANPIFCYIYVFKSK